MIACVKAHNLKAENNMTTEDGHFPTNTFTELDDSRHVMERLDKKKAQANGETYPRYKPRGEVPKSKKKRESRSKSN